MRITYTGGGIGTHLFINTIGQVCRLLSYETDTADGHEEHIGHRLKNLETGEIYDDNITGIDWRKFSQLKIGRAGEKP